MRNCSCPPSTDIHSYPPPGMLNFLSRKVTNYLEVCTIPKQGNPQRVSHKGNSRDLKIPPSVWIKDVIHRVSFWKSRGQNSSVVFPWVFLRKINISVSDPYAGWDGKRGKGGCKKCLATYPKLALTFQMEEPLLYLKHIIPFYLFMILQTAK